MNPVNRTFLRSVPFIPLIALFIFNPLLSQTTQEQVHQKAHSVMPFDIAQTVHIFKMTETGGIQQVLAKDPTAMDQIERIRRHLEHEADNFQRGNYVDPARLHGEDMPGLRELAAGASRIKVAYTALPAGGEIAFTTTELPLLTAVHRWFGAQLSEHCADARTE